MALANRKEREMNEKIEQIISILGSMRVDGMANFEKLVYVKLLLENLKVKEDTDVGGQDSK